jgi:hypothetical protein
LTFPHPGLYWIYGNKDDDDDIRKLELHTASAAQAVFLEKQVLATIF